MADDDCPVAVEADPVAVSTPEPPPATVPDHWLYQIGATHGATEVIHHHGGYTAELIDVWADRYAALGARAGIGYVLVCTLHDPAGARSSGHVFGYPDIPPRPAAELAAASAHHRAHGRCVYCDVIAQERADGVRIVADNAYFLAFVPFAPRVPDEVHVAAHRHATSLLDLTDPERAALAALLATVTRGYERTSDRPYISAVHQAPPDRDDLLPLSHFHVELSPTPQSSGPQPAELGAGVRISTGTPEQVAARLRRAAAG